MRHKNYRSIDTITAIDSNQWDILFENRGIFSYNGLKCMEEIFSNNSRVEQNWSFHYLIITDADNEIILATFFTSGIYKDDLLATENVSRKIEEQRLEDPFYLCSKTLAMGSLFSEGNHLYVNESHVLIDEAFRKFFEIIDQLKKQTASTVVILRDFEADCKLDKCFESEGFIKVGMSNTNIVQNPKWNTKDELISFLRSKNNISNIKRYVFRYEADFDVSFKKSLTEQESQEHFNLFLNVKNNNLALNFFDYPKKMMKIMSEYDEWEFVEFRLKGSNELIGSISGFVGDSHYCPLIVGLNYDYIKSHHLYKQVMYYMVKRGNDLDKTKTFLGLTSDYEKQKYNAILTPVFAYVKIDNTYNLDLISSLG